jgi:hypothetical protein
MATELKTPELSRNAAAAFADKWKSYTDEKQHARGFWSDFFRALCGVDDEEIAGIEYEKRVKSTISGNQEYIDVYWKNVALIEHKSAGENLDKAELQARGYWLSLPPGYRPKTIIISDFLNFRLIDVALNRTHDFPLSKLPENIHRFEAITSGNRTRISEEEITVDQVAAKLMANLYLELEDHGFEGHETSIFLIRILFLLFGDDTGMWTKNTFLKLVMGTKEDGTDVGPKFDTLFEVLNTPEDKRTKGLGDEFKPFPYVNGGIFAEKISVIDFNKKMRVALVDVANYDWTTINPTIFGSLFQLIKNKEARRELGEHYTTEENINKIVYPLFLDELNERLAAAWDNKKELKKLRQDLAKIKIFDPACGCGNFLVVSYRHLRQLELELTVRLNNLEGNQDSQQLDGSMGLSINLNQLHGIEIEEWPAQVARMALFLTDHQENLKFERITGATPNRFPLKDAAHITHGNALTINWSDIIDINESTYLLGNPPFLGHISRSKEQTDELIQVWGRQDIGRLDYVTAWYKKASDALSHLKNARFAFVSTNSITQGEPVPALFGPLFAAGWRIRFAHRTFAWSSESVGMAHVHCVIIGFDKEVGSARLFTYTNIKSEPVSITAKNINGYLADGPNVLVEQTRNVLGYSLPQVSMGSMPRDGGHLLIDSETEYQEVMKDKVAAKYVRKYAMGNELINNIPRWCLWLEELEPGDINKSPQLKARLKAVSESRLQSSAESTRQMAQTPHLFGQRSQSKTPYLGIPKVFSESRRWATVALLPVEVIAGDKIYKCDDPDGFAFAIASSSMFITWQKSVGGRLKSDPSFSNTLVWNSLPLPALGPDLKAEIIQLGNEIIKVRDTFEGKSLADIYNPLGMSPSLIKAHENLDRLVDKAFGAMKALSSNVERETLLFEQYLTLTNPISI